MTGPDGAPAPVPATGSRRRPLLPLVVPLAAGLVALDQLTKSLAISGPADGPVEVLPAAQLQLTSPSLREPSR